MTLQELCEMLSEPGFPVVHHEWKRDSVWKAGEPPGPPPLPYIIYLTPESDGIYADGVAALTVTHIRTELYTATKERDVEKALETTLKTHRISYEKDESAISEEGLYVAGYEFDIMEG